jgi:hypothetical protein
MNDEHELQDLRKRIGRLPLGYQLSLFELVIGDYRRKCAEARVESLQPIEVLREHERPQARITAEHPG